MKIDNVKIKKKIGYGSIGSSYFAEDASGHEYVYKIEKILPSDIKKNYNYMSPWREIDFFKNVASKYPTQFMQMYDYKFIDDCTHIQSSYEHIKYLPKQRQLQIAKLIKSKYCFARLYDYRGPTIGRIIDKLSTKQIYSMFIQILYIIYILKKHKYQHNDLHQGNITTAKTDKKFIKIFNLDVPTFGYIYSAIDYGMVTNKKYKISPWEKKVYINTPDLNMLFNSSYFNKSHDDKFKYIDKLIKNKKIKSYSEHYKKYMKQMKQTPEYKKIVSIINNKDIAQGLFKIIHHNLSDELLLGKYYKKFNFSLRIPIENIVYIATHSNDIKNIITYLYKCI